MNHPNAANPKAGRIRARPGANLCRNCCRCATLYSDPKVRMIAIDVTMRAMHLR